jgi:hypothetical protein
VEALEFGKDFWILLCEIRGFRGIRSQVSKEHALLEFNLFSWRSSGTMDGVQFPIDLADRPFIRGLPVENIVLVIGILICENWKQIDSISKLRRALPRGRKKGR